MSSNISSQLSRFERELLALKSGFTGDETRYFDSVITQETFNVNTAKPITIVTDFVFQDFPQLFTTVYIVGNPFPLAPYVTIRQDIYRWRIYLDSPADDYEIQCVLLSENTPTMFHVEVDP
jgi:hypothetical protein